MPNQQLTFTGEEDVQRGLFSWVKGVTRSLQQLKVGER